MKAKPSMSSKPSQAGLGKIIVQNVRSVCGRARKPKRGGWRDVVKTLTLRSGAFVLSREQLKEGTRRRVRLLSVTHLVDDFYQGSVPALVPLFAAERGYTGVAAGGLMFAGTFVSSLLQPGFGLLTDRLRMPWLVWVGMLTAGFGVSASGVADNYLYSWLAITLAGMGVAAFHPEGARATRETAGGSARAMSWFSVGGNIGLALAPVIITPVISAYGLGATPILVVPGALLAAGFVYRMINDRGMGRTRSQPGPALGSSSVREIPEGKDNWSMFSWLLVVVIMRSIAYVGVSTFFVLYLEQRFGLGATLASPALTVFMGVGACGTIIGGWLADRYGRTVIIRLGYSIAIVALVLIALAPSVPMAYLAAVGSGLGLYLPFAVHTTLGQEYLPRRLATASGMTTGLGISAGGVLAPLLGRLADAQGRHAVFVVLIAAPVSALLASIPLKDAPDPEHETGR